METINKLQFKHHNEIFTGETLDEARGKVLTYLREQWYATEAFNDPSSNYRSLYAEPTVFRYAAAGDEANPHVILLIGAKTNNNSDQADNRFCIIDIDKTEQEIEDLREEIEKVVKSLTLTVFDTKTLDLSVEKTEDGTFLSGDVKTADTHVFELDGEELNKRNNLLIGDGDAKGPEGLFLYIDLTYDEENDRYTFLVSQADGTLKKVILPNNYLVSGEYDITDEAIHLHMKDGEEIVVDCKELILEWTVEGEGSNTPIVLTRERVDYDPEGHHDHEDILRADIRVAEELPNNILDKTADGRYLYVKGTADNIRYSDEMTVKEAIDSKDDRISTSEGNLIYRREDGIYAHTMLKYNQAENKIGFEYTDGDGELNFVEYQLNSLKFLEDITYDPVNETIIIRYIDTKGEYKQVVIPVKDIIEEWDVNNEYHNVNLVKQRSAGQGKDLLSADVKIHEGDNNILEDEDHTLYVNGISDNIKYDVTGDTTVKNVLDTLSAASVSVNDRLDEEISRSEAEDTKIENTIGSGFSTDAHETITYKFNELTDRVAAEETRAAEEENRIEAKLDAEITRSTAKDVEEDGRLDSIETNIGDGFGSRNTVRDEFTKEKAEREASDNFLSGTIETLSANTEGRLKSVVNNDHSINVDNTDAVNPVIKLNLSTEVEDEKPNIIKLNTDGLYAGVDLSYVEEANKLIFKTTNGTKEIQLESMSSIIDIRYDASKEAIVITYMTNGHEIKTVEIPVGDLIREWKPSESTDGAIKMTLTEAPSGTTHKDILYAEVLLSSHEDNILVNDNGTLYVSDSRIASLEGRVDTAEADIDTLESGLANEITRATAAETTLTNNLAQEVEDRTNDVNAEQSRAEAAELALSGKIDTDVLAEKNRAISVETALQTAINNEITRATNKEARIEESLNDEITRSITVDADNTSRISTLETNLRDEIERAQSNETSLNNAINSETTRARNVEQALTTSINTEKNDRISGDTILSNAIVAESSTRLTEDTRIEGKLDAFTADTMSEIHEVHDLISAETARSREADAVLEQKITTEESRAKGEETRIEGVIGHETTRAIAEEARIEQKLDSEISRAKREEELLTNSIASEAEDRIAADTALSQRIDDNTLTFEDSSTVDFTRERAATGDSVSAIVKLEEGENIIKRGNGLYATVRLNYDTARNTIWLTTTNGAQQEIQLNTVGSLIDSIVYDAANRKLVITYHDGAGNVHTIDVPVGQLFNDWTVDNPSDNSAVELTKTIVAGDSPDLLSARVKLSTLSDNALVIDSNGLYVSSTIMDGAMEKAICVGNELKSVESQIFGYQVAEECGSGFTYTPPIGTVYVNTATTVNNAVFLLDKAIHDSSVYTQDVDSRLATTSAKTDCNTDEILTLENNYLGITIDHSINPCGSGTRYQPSEGTKYISGATTFKQADAMLDTAIKETADRVTINEFNINQLSSHVDDLQTEVDTIETGAGLNTDGTYNPSLDGKVISGATSLKNADELLNNALEDLRDDLDELMIGSDTVSTHMWVEQVYNNKHLKADVRLSRGNTELEGEGMTAEDMFIKDFSGQTIESGVYEFTDTNVLRIVDTTEYNPAYRYDSKWHGVYLSNAWNCGKYYQASTESAEIAEMVSEGYEIYDTEYRTDETSAARSYDYTNKKRQTDV